jgi:hypothetical protein
MEARLHHSFALKSCNMQKFSLDANCSIHQHQSYGYVFTWYRKPFCKKCDGEVWPYLAKSEASTPFQLVMNAGINNFNSMLLILTLRWKMADVGIYRYVVTVNDKPN